MHKNHILNALIRRTNVNLAIALLLGLGVVGGAFAANDSDFTQVINAGTLTADIVDSDSGYSSVANPAVALSAKTFSFACLSGGSASTGTFGTTDEAIYISNPDAADNGWTLTLAATGGATSVWDAGASTDYDFNDGNGSGCTDGGGDADLFGGQLTVNPNAGTLSVGQCSGCVTTNVSKGSSTPFAEGSTDSVTILTGANTSDDIGDWKLIGATLSQTIPAAQVTGSYSLNMTLTATAS